MERDEFLQIQQVRVARLAASPSATRNQGTGVVKTARDFLGQLELTQFSNGDCGKFRRTLDAVTAELVQALPPKGSSWGLARKILNIFLRDVLYHAILRCPSGLEWVEECLEVPLDSITADRIKHSSPPRSLPIWPGVRNLTQEQSDHFQEASFRIAEERGVARIHLDAVWWGGEGLLKVFDIPRSATKGQRVKSRNADECSQNTAVVTIWSLDFPEPMEFLS